MQGLNNLANAHNALNNNQNITVNIYGNADADTTEKAVKKGVDAGNKSFVNGIAALNGSN